MAFCQGYKRWPLELATISMTVLDIVVVAKSSQLSSAPARACRQERDTEPKRSQLLKVSPPLTVLRRRLCPTAPVAASAGAETRCRVEHCAGCCHAAVSVLP